MASHKKRNRGIRKRERFSKTVVSPQPEGTLSKALSFLLEETPLSGSFPSSVEKEVEKMGEVTNFSRRVDLRDLPFLTIDGDKAKDFDDAVYLKKEKDHYELYVAIADVAHYVKEGTFTDQEALRRGTSIYLVERVFPMLPEKLSNDLCSLSPGKDRLVQGVRIVWNRKGVVLETQFFKGVIRSFSRLTYTQVNRFLEGEDREEIPYPIRTVLRHMKELTLLLREQRERRGGLDFDLREPEFVFGREGNVEAILYPERGLAHFFIEEFMIAANTLVATYLTQAGFPIIYRVHDPPPLEKYAFLRRFCERVFSVRLPSTPTHSVYQRLMRQFSNPPLSYLVPSLILRSLSPARYSSDPLPHFGLNLPLYCHFTSPIRRYPDLVVHRLFREYLEKGSMRESKVKELRGKLSEVARKSTEREVFAMEKEREFVRYLKALFMKGEVGKEYDGVVTGVSSFGLFVTLEEVFVDGLIPLRALPRDHYEYHEELMELKGEKVLFSLGDRVKVKLVEVDERKGRLYFVLKDHIPLLEYLRKEPLPGGFLWQR